MARSRRNFLQTGLSLAAATSLAGLLPAGMGLQSCSGRKEASDRVRVALIGCRNMGFTNACGFIEQPDVDLVAVCDIDKNIRESRMTDIQKYAYEKKIVVPKPDDYEDFRRILERKDIDAVIIATPDHWHALITIMACQAGKDVYVEKPAANSIFEADQMVNAAKRYNRVVQVGQWQRSGLHWQDMVDYIRSEKLGKISHVDAWRLGGNPLPKVPDAMVPAGVNYDLWLGPAPQKPFNPNRFHYNFRWFWDYAGGKMTDWGVHLLDMAMWALKLDQPDTITASGGNLVYPDSPMETPDTLTVEYQFNQVLLTWHNNFGIQTNEFGFDHGVAFYGDNGVLRANRNYWEVVPTQVAGVPVVEPTSRNTNAGNDLSLHIRNFLDAIKSRNFNTAANISIGRNVARIAHMGNIAYRTGSSLSWNSETGTFNQLKANEYLKPEYRKPWEINKIT